jgi:hypothetical protein
MIASHPIDDRIDDCIVSMIGLMIVSYRVEHCIASLIASHLIDEFTITLRPTVNCPESRHHSSLE